MMAGIAAVTADGGARAASRAAVALSDVTIAFRLADGGTYKAVESASLNVADGEFVAIVGPTGCGKTTLLNAAAGLFPPIEPAGSISSAPTSTASTASPATCFSPRRCFPGKPRATTSLSAWRPLASREPRPCSAHKTG